MTSGQTIWSDAQADNLPLSLGCMKVPIDLHAVARHRKVRKVTLRLMVRRGALVPVSDGFQVFVRNLEMKDLDIGAPEPEGILNSQQRFTLAHEIAHTFFYKDRGGVPVSTGKVKKYGGKTKEHNLEERCDRIAKRLLVPSHFLKMEIASNLGNDQEKIDIEFVRRMVTRFRVSYEVMLDRLSTVASNNQFGRCIVLVRKRDNEARICNHYIGMGLLSVLPPFREYRPVTEWFPNLPLTITAGYGNRKSVVTTNGQQLSVRRFDLRRRGEYLLQFDIRKSG